MQDAILNEIRIFLKGELAEVNDTVINSFKSESEVISKIISYLLSSGGKKIRSIFAISSAKLCGYNNKNHISHVAATIEIIHNATLLHDDVIDNNTIRRGKKNAKGVWGNQISVLAGDLFLSVAFKTLLKCNNITAVSELADVAFLLAEGEIRQLSNIGKIISEKEYLQTIQLKTASLFGIACKLSAILAADIAYQQALYDFGLNIGMAFQIIDDILDYDDSGCSGKAVGNDLYNSKVTLPVILAYEAGNLEEQSFWKSSFSAVGNTNTKQAIDLLRKHDIFSKCMDRAKTYVGNCLDLLSSFPDSEIKSLLKQMLQFTLYRDF